MIRFIAATALAVCSISTIVRQLESKDSVFCTIRHGSAQTRPFPMVERTRRYVERLRETMREAVENGVSLLDSTEHTDFDDWKAVPLYESNQRANAAFVYREMEQAYFNE